MRTRTWVVQQTKINSIFWMNQENKYNKFEWHAWMNSQFLNQNDWKMIKIIVLNRWTKSSSCVFVDFFLQFEMSYVGQSSNIVQNFKTFLFSLLFCIFSSFNSRSLLLPLKKEYSLIVMMVLNLISHFFHFFTKKNVAKVGLKCFHTFLH